MQFTTRVEVNWNSPKTFRRVTVSPEYSGTRCPRGIQTTPTRTMSASVGEPGLGSTLTLDLISVERVVCKKQGLRLNPHKHSDV